MASRRKKPRGSLLQRAIAEVGGVGRTTIGCRPAEYMMRKGFRKYDRETIETVWRWYSQTDKAGNRLFSQADIARYLGLPPGAVGAMCRCMPEDWQP